MAISYEFDVSADALFTKMTDPEFLKLRCEELGEIKVKASAEEDGDKKTVVLDRTIRRDLPKILAKMFNAENRTIMTEKWQRNGDGYEGNYEIKVKSQPVTIFADFSIEPGGDGCFYTIEHGCKAKVPMVAKHVEKFVLGQIGDGLQKEIDVLVEHL